MTSPHRFNVYMSSKQFIQSDFPFSNSLVKISFRNYPVFHKKIWIIREKSEKNERNLLYFLSCPINHRVTPQIYFPLKPCLSASLPPSRLILPVQRQLLGQHCPLLSKAGICWCCQDTKCTSKNINLFEKLKDDFSHISVHILHRMVSSAVLADKLGAL